MLRLAPLLVTAALVAAPTAAVGSDLPVLVADFEGADGLRGWSVLAEEGRASGTLVAADGHSGQGAALSYRLGGVGAWAAAVHQLAVPVAAPAVGLRLWTPRDAVVSVVVVDATGQTLEYLVLRPFHAVARGGWYEEVLVLDAPSSWVGGAGDGLVHDGVHALAVLVRSLVPETVSGTVGLDEVVLLEVPELELDPRVAPAPWWPAGATPLRDRLGVNVHFRHEGTLARPEVLAAARDAGFAWVRTDLSWDQVERERGRYDLTPWDELLDTLDAYGLRALLILDYGHPLHTSGLPPISEAGIAAFGAYAEAAARHFAGRGVRWEIWNEPNAPPFWPPRPDPAAFARLARAAAQSVRAGDPAAVIVTGGVTSHDYPFLAAMLAAGAADGADAVGVHPYLEIPEQLALYLPWVQAIGEATGTAGLPLWQTEWGYSSAAGGDGHSAEGRRTQAVMVVRELLLSWAMGFPLMVHYELVDGGPDPADHEGNFGLLTVAGGEKPALAAVRNLVEAGAGGRPAGFIATPLAYLCALRLAYPTHTVVAVWYAAPGAPVTLRVPTGSVVTDLFGEPVAVPPDRRLWLGADTGPVFVRVDGAPPRPHAAPDAPASG